MVWLMADWEVPSFAAARVKLRSCATMRRPVDHLNFLSLFISIQYKSYLIITDYHYKSPLLTLFLSNEQVNKAMKKVWLITGASSGLGQALAQAVIAQGDLAVITARRLDRLQQIAYGHEDQVLAVALDVTDATARSQVIDQAIQHFGRIDVLANIAGRGVVGACEEFSLQQLREQMVDFFAAAEMTRAVLPQMRQQASGHILTLSSIAGLVAMNAAGPYCAAKFAIEGWTESLALEVKTLGIHVTLVEPGAFRTEFAGDVNMRPAQHIQAYRAVVEPFEQYLKAHRVNNLVILPKLRNACLKSLKVQHHLPV
jgi:short-subunit dehydrogenase